MIHAHNVHKDFQLGGRWVPALNGIDLEIMRGQFVAVMGPSGSGKSTLLYLLGGLDRPTSGDIMVNEQHLNDLNGDELAQFRRETVGFVFQAFHLVPSMTALDNVGLPGVFAGIPREEREQRAFRLLDRLGMSDRTDHRPAQLSGGQQQRVAIARALFNNPPLIMADEPTGALDSKTGQTVVNLLRWLSKKHGKTVIVVTHDENIARQTDRVIRLRDGHVTADQVIADQVIANQTAQETQHAE